MELLRDSRTFELRDSLVNAGMAELAKPRRLVPFTGDGEADLLLNDLEGMPHAFLFACLMDRQVRAELAWKVPSVIRQRHGSFAIVDLEPLSEADWLELLRNPSPAHRMPETMAKALHLGTRRVIDRYQGDASQIWIDSPASAAVVRRILEFYGAGPKIATMAANILVREFHIPMADYRYIDISADTQVVRVMRRLGFVDADADEDVVIYAARELNPDFPGIFDLALWRLGRTLCRPTSPRCPSCDLKLLCAFGRAPA
jgi:endonuclease III